MQKSALILLVLSALLVLGTEAQNTINNFLATRLLFDLDLDCPASRIRRGGTVSRAEINQAFTLADSASRLTLSWGDKNTSVVTTFVATSMLLSLA